MNRPLATLDRKSRIGLCIHRIICYVILLFLCVGCLFFFYILIINATRTNNDIQRGISLLPDRYFMENLTTVLNNSTIPILSGLKNSLIVSSCTAVLSTYFSALTAYGIYAYQFRFKKLAYATILLIMMMPTQVSAMGFVRLITAMGMKDTLWPLFLPNIAAPVVFFFIKQYMEANLSLEIVEAARIDGAHELRTFHSIVLPVIKPALAVQAIFTFVSAWNNYFLPALILDSSQNKTVPILIAELRSADYLKFNMASIYMTIAIAIVPVIIVYFFLSKYIVGGVSMGSVKG